MCSWKCVEAFRSIAANSAVRLNPNVVVSTAEFVCCIPDCVLRSVGSFKLCDEQCPPPFPPGFYRSCLENTFSPYLHFVYGLTQRVPFLMAHPSAYRRDIFVSYPSDAYCREAFKVCKSFCTMMSNLLQDRVEYFTRYDRKFNPP